MFHPEVRFPTVVRAFLQPSHSLFTGLASGWVSQNGAGGQASNGIKQVTGPEVGEDRRPKREVSLIPAVDGHPGHPYWRSCTLAR